MIRVYSSDFTPHDYAKIAQVLQQGLKIVCPVSDCIKARCCAECEHHKVCKAVLSAAYYCERRSKMVEP